MCVRDGVERIILLSSASAPWLSRSYIRSKRAAEEYVRRLGLRAIIVRAPLLYTPGSARPLFYRLMTLVGAMTPLRWLPAGRSAPMPVDVFARGVALCAGSEQIDKQILFAGDLRRRVKRAAEANDSGGAMSLLQSGEDEAGAFESLQEELPFGWSPDDERR